MVVGKLPAQKICQYLGQIHILVFVLLLTAQDSGVPSRPAALAILAPRASVAATARAHFLQHFPGFVPRCYLSKPLSSGIQRTELRV